MQSTSIGVAGTSNAYVARGRAPGAETAQAGPGETMTYSQQTSAPNIVSRVVTGFRETVARASHTTTLCLGLALCGLAGGCATVPGNAQVPYPQGPPAAKVHVVVDSDRGLQQAGNAVGQIKNGAVDAYHGVANTAVHGWHEFMKGFKSTQ